MTAYDDYVAARDHADDCFQVMLDLYKEASGLVLSLLPMLDEDDAARLVRQERQSRALAAFEASVGAFHEAENAYHAAFRRWIDTMSVPA